MTISPYTLDELWETQIRPVIDATAELSVLTKDATEDNPAIVGDFKHSAPYSTNDHVQFALIMAAIRQDIADLRREVKRLTKSAKAKGGAK